MHRPVLITPPDMLPVSLPEAKAHLRVDFNDDDTLIENLIDAAISHLDGWTGVLGRCLAEQEWSQYFDYGSCLPLALAPVLSITSVTVDGVTLDKSEYALLTDAGGRSRVEIASDAGPATVVYKAGYETIPAALKAAILLLVGHWYHNREAATGSLSELPLAVDALIAPYRRVGV